MRTLRTSQLLGVVAALTAVLPIAVAAQATNPPPKVLFACYVPATGTVYRIREPGLPENCQNKNNEKHDHIMFSWSAEGLQGPAGPQGVQGVAGPQGIVGPTGPQGVPGGKGEAGVQGVSGPAGPQGMSGAGGAAGPSGPIGPSGASGPKGERGDDGPSGPQGPKGDSGERGAGGPQGERGQVGPSGPSGPQGDRGTDGASGPSGPEGLQGVQGPQGLTGPQGLRGPTGPQGPQGNPGLSGYEVIQRDLTCAANTECAKQVFCSFFKVVIGGGFSLQSNSNNYVIRGTHPVDNNTGWGVTVDNRSPYPTEFSVFATCVRAF